MKSPPYQRFIKSMAIDYEKWHDGEGYDLAALAELQGAERAEIERTLLGRADNDWRDLEALAQLDTPAGWRAIERVARGAGDNAVHAARLLAEKSPGHGEEVLELQLLQSMRTLKPDAPVAPIIDEAACHPTDAIKKALLDAAAFSSNSTFRVHAAALLLYLAGQTKEPFDWAERPFFLRFGSKLPRDVGEAHQELRRRLGLGGPAGPT